MAKVKLILDTRSKKKDGTYPIKIRLSHKTKSYYDNTGVSVTKSEWDEEEGEIIGSLPIKKQMNLKLKRHLMQLQVALLEVETTRHISYMSPEELMNCIKQQAGWEIAVKRNLFVPRFEEFVSSKKAIETQKRYRLTLSYIKQYDERWDTLTFEDITLNWLESFADWLRKPHGHLKPKNENSIILQMSTIKTLMKVARKEKLTSNDPFIDFKLKGIPTKKRSLSLKEMHNLWNYIPKTETLKFYHDLFKLSFSLIGMNPVDMMLAKKEQYNGEHLNYIRCKTKKAYNVKVLPEAAEILEKYQCEGEYLLPIYNKYKGNIRSFRVCFSKYLQQIDKRISAYWARHTWATLAAELDIPKETIAGALGHSIGMDVTSIYIRFDQRKIDKANRKVMDTVLKGELPEED